MATAPTLPILSVEEYLNSTWRPDKEYVDGSLVERNVGSIPHSRLQRILLVYLEKFRATLNIEALPECRTKVFPTRYRVPDVSVVQLPYDRNARFYDGVPLVIIELLSPDDRLRESLQRFADYAALGVPHILQMDPEDRVTRVYRDGGLFAVRLETLELPNGAVLDFNSQELLAALDE